MLIPSATLANPHQSCTNCPTSNTLQQPSTTNADQGPRVTRSILYSPQPRKTYPLKTRTTAPQHNHIFAGTSDTPHVNKPQTATITNFRNLNNPCLLTSGVLL